MINTLKSIFKQVTKKNIDIWWVRERFSTVYSTPLPPNSLSNQELSVVHIYDSIITYKTVPRKFSQAPDLGFSSDFYFPLILIEQLYGSAFGYARFDILLGNKVTTANGITIFIMFASLLKQYKLPSSLISQFKIIGWQLSFVMRLFVSLFGLVSKKSFDIKSNAVFSIEKKIR